MPADYEGIGFFQNQWRNPPHPFNPAFDPGASARYSRVTSSMEADGYYVGHTREECRVEWRRRYEADKKATSPDTVTAMPQDEICKCTSRQATRRGFPPPRYAR